MQGSKTTNSRVEIYSILSFQLLWQLSEDNSQNAFIPEAFCDLCGSRWASRTLKSYQHPSNPTLWQQLYIALCVYKELIIKLLLHSNRLNLHRSIKVLDQLWTVPPSLVSLLPGDACLHLRQQNQKQTREKVLVGGKSSAGPLQLLNSHEALVVLHLSVTHIFRHGSEIFTQAKPAPHHLILWPHAFCRKKTLQNRILGMLLRKHKHWSHTGKATTMNSQPSNCDGYLTPPQLSGF